MQRRARALVGACLLAPFLYGAAGVLSADGSVTFTLPRVATPPSGTHNLVSYRYGPTLRASSFHRHPSSYRSPILLLDGEGIHGSPWASSGRDRAPWVEIEWREPRSVSAVRIDRGGSARGGAAELPGFELRCLPPGSPQSSVRVGPGSLREAHPLTCKQARGLRIDWHLGAKDRAWAYEIEVWGR